MPFKDSITPFVFLAFANPRNDLDRLADEHSSIRVSLEKAEKAGLCEFIERFNLNISTLINIFQDSRLANRISIFHFGGHAGDFELILNNSEIEGHSFNKFLHEISSLRLVFLNGCSTLQQAQELLKLGIPAVIATSQEIPDDIAKEFASRFYNGIAEGLSIKNAFNQAKLAILSSSSNSIKVSQTLSDPRKQKKELEILWNLYSTNEDADNWKLADEISNPYFGLPKPINYFLPQAPYIYLKPYTEKESLIFWGRGIEIKDLFIRVMDKNANPVILMYGQTGVGKSSRGVGGLVPRLKAVSNVFYLRRLPGLGLIKTLQKALNIPSENFEDFISSFNSLAQSSGKRAVIIIDQLEEVFTKPIKGLDLELKDFFSLLAKITNSIGSNNVKIILGYRKEFHAEIESESININLSFFTYFLQPLNRENIIEIINGSNLSVTTRNQYCINIDKDLDERIADDLAKDIDSPIAPILQILLSKLWEKSAFENNSKRFFSKKLYYDLKDNGLALGDFINQKIVEIAEWNKDVVESGLLLDILYFHTTPLGTSASNEFKLIIERYDNSTFIKKIIQKCKDLYLLSEDKDSGEHISLAHDTLAPIIRALFESSLKDGQKANRILQNQETYLVNDKAITPLNERDLEVVEKGSKGMRKWNDREVKLVAKSQEERGRIIRQKKIRNIILGIAAIGIATLSIISFIYWQQAKNQANIAAAQQKAAQSRVLADQPLQFLTAAQLALDGLNQYNSLETNQAARYILSRMLIPINFVSFHGSLSFRGGTSNIAFSNDNKYFVAAASSSSETYIKVINVENGKLFKEFSGKIEFNNYQGIKFSEDSKYIILKSNGGLILYSLFTNNPPKDIDGNYMSEISPNLKYLVFTSYDYDSNRESLQIRNIESNQIDQSIIYKEGISKLHFMPNMPNTLVIGKEDGSVVIRNLETKMSFNLQGIGKVTSLAIDETGNYVAIGHESGEINVWDIFSHNKISSLHHNKQVTEMHFSQNDKRLVSQSEDGTTRIWNTLNGQEISRHNLYENPAGAFFLKGGEYFASASYGDNVKTFNSLTGEEFGVVPLNSGVSSISADRKGKYIATADDDGNAIIWSISVSDPSAIFRHRSEISSLQVLNNLILSSSAEDGSVRCWDSKTAKEIYKIQHDYRLWNHPILNSKTNLIASTSENVIVKNRLDSTYNLNVNLFSRYHEKYVFDENNNLLSINLNLDSTKQIGEHPIYPTRIPYEEEVPIVYIDSSGLLLGGEQKPQTIKRKITFDVIFDKDRKKWGGFGSGALGPIAFNGDGKLLATSSRDMIWIWDILNKKLLSRISQGYEVLGRWSGNNSTELRLEMAHISRLFITQDSKTLLTESRNGILRCWDIANPNKPNLITIRRSLCPLAFKMDISLPIIATEADSNKLYLLNPRDFSKRDSLISKRNIVNCFFSTDGDQIAIVSFEKTKSFAKELKSDANYFIEVWNLKNHKKTNQFIIHNQVNNIAFSSDVRYIAVAQENALVSIWDFKTGKEVSRIIHKGSVKSVFFANNDRVIVSTIGPTGRTKTNDYSNEVLLSYWKQEDLSKLLTERINAIPNKK
jgi:WD40 repeat protein